MKGDSKTLVISSIKPLQRGRLAIYFNGEKKPYETDKRSGCDLAPGMTVVLKKGKLVKQ